MIVNNKKGIIMELGTAQLDMYDRFPQSDPRNCKSSPCKCKYQVVNERFIKNGVVKVKFEGTREACLEYMRDHYNVDLMFRGRMASYVLN